MWPKRRDHGDSHSTAPAGVIPTSSFGATSWSFPAMKVWFEVINSLYREKGRRAEEMSEPA